MNVLRLSFRVRSRLAAVLFAVLLLEAVSGMFTALLFELPRAAAAPVVIEASPSTDGPSHSIAGSQTVFVNDLVGYKFFRASGGACQYRKTTNGGTSWGSPTSVDTQTDCIGVSVWYDQWTPGDTGSLIHIVTMDTGDDDLFYNALNTSNDTLASTTARAVITVGSTNATYASNANRANITKGTNGIVYVVADDATGSGTILRRCSGSCTITANWSAAGTPPQGNADSWSMLLPLSGGNIMLINRSTGNLLRYSVWDGSDWDTFQNIDASAVRGTTYDVNMAATLDHESGDIFLAYVTDANDFVTADHDIRTAVYSGGSWTNTADVVTNSGRGIHQVALARDQNTGNLYLAYTARTTITLANTSRVYWHLSTSSMQSWGVEQGPLDSSAGDFYGIDLNIMSYDRIYASWFDNVAAVRDIFGETLADIGPEVRVSATGTQIATVRSETNNFYVGGKFILDAIATRTVSSITIAENGTVDGESELDNIKLFYEYDTSAPYNCASESYDGDEIQFGSTETDGFSGADGTASFNVTPLAFSSTSPLCLYTVVDVLSTADDNETIQIHIQNPEVDVVVSSVEAYPATAVALSGTTTIADPNLTQNAYHWRLDNGTEVTASSATNGVENTAISALQKNTPRRLRLGVSNEGSTSSLPVSFVLEYGVAAPSCDTIPNWTVLNDASPWVMYDSSNLTEGANTNDIATSSGGVSNGNSSFISSNGGVRDTTATSSAVTLGTTNFVELEYSIVATTTAVEGETYCFRVSRSGTALGTYTAYPQVTIAADVTVSATGTQATSSDVGTPNNYYGGTFRIVENSGSRNFTAITFTEQGTVNAATGISSVSLRYEFDTSAPYNCVSESFDGSELTFGTTQPAFSSADGTVTFNDVVGIDTTSALCLYLTYSVTTAAAHGETVNIVISSPATDVAVSGGGSVGPSTVVDMSGTTTLRSGILTQNHFHWRRDNGSETTASSATNGVEDTGLTDFARSSAIRLRLGVSNEGPTTSVPTQLYLEYGLKITTCANVSTWTEVGTTTDGWDMYNSSFITDGSDTTNIATSTGGVSDENTSFLTANGGVRDQTSRTGTTTLSSTEFTELEFSLTSTEDTAYEATYCFRLTAAGTPLPTYTNYAELTTAPKRDFRIQRGVTTVSGTSTAIVAGVDYTAPSSTSRAFIRITNTFDTGAGRTTGGVTQNLDDVTTYILNPSNLLTSITFARPSTAINNTRVAWEIIEYVGESGTDNEMVVRAVGTINMASASTTATTSVISGIGDDADVVVFVTGSQSRGTTQNYYSGQFTSSWGSTTDQASFQRGASASTLADLSYAVVEFTGLNWSVQRVEHTYATSSGVETENITPVESLGKTFLYAQKRTGAQANVINFGHEVWLSSIGAVSFRLEPLASVAIPQVSVAWVISNSQQGNSGMSVQRNNGNTSGGTAPLALSVTIPSPIDATNNASIFGNGRGGSANTQYPNIHTGMRITSTSTFELWRGATGVALSYRTEIVEWPVSDIGVRQNAYMFFVHNNAITPTDPWPAGPVNIGESTPIGVGDEPLANGDVIRIRLTARVSNANMPAGLRAFKLQYGVRAGSCAAIETWTDVGSATSSAIWRGYVATGTTDGSSLGSDPPQSGEILILSTSDVLGRLVHQNPAAPNPYTVLEGEDVEYDWQIVHNGAVARTTYCFRMVQSDGTLLDGYLDYPQIRTAGYNPVMQNWRWYSDYENITPTTALAAENTAPTGIVYDSGLALRVAVGETKAVSGNDIRFRLQFSDDPTFLLPRDVAASSTCSASDNWCYINGGATDHSDLASSTLSDSDPCVMGVGSGCGLHVSSGVYQAGHAHAGGTVQEHSFTIRHAGARAKAVYYFRLYDTINDVVVPLGSGESYPSLLTEAPVLQFSVADLPSGTSTAGIVTDATTTSSTISFGRLALDTDYEAAHRLSVGINATEGYQLFFYARSQLINSSGDVIPPLSATNAAPVAWEIGCPVATSTGCVGYHTTDGTLAGGSGRFAPNNTYAGLATTPQEIMYSSLPTSDTHDIIYRVRIGDQQPAGDYSAEVVYLAIPVY